MGKGQGETIQFWINGKEHNVNATSRNIGPRSMLVDYIRDVASLKGTKSMCREGGCGACVVTARTKDSVTGKIVAKAINSCLTPVFSCNGWEISTVEDLGNKRDGLSLAQTRLMNFNGTQCGFCTPGMVMSMNSLIESKDTTTVKDVEDSFDGNICRCTGHRPILDAFKSMAVDAPESLRNKHQDIEDCSTCPCTPEKSATCKKANGVVNNDCVVTNGRNGVPGKSGCCKSVDSATGDETLNGTVKQPCSVMKSVSACCKNTITKGSEVFNGLCKQKSPSADTISIPLTTGETWVVATNLETVFTTLQKCQLQGLSYRFVAGNTATGVYRDEAAYKVFIDVNNVAAMHKVAYLKSESGLLVGAGTTLSKAIEVLKEAGKTKGFEYGAKISKHIERIANVPVRNNGTLAGNLMIKHKHPEFPSDIFMLLEAVGAEAFIATPSDTGKCYTLPDFLALDMSGKLLVSIHFPQRKGYIFRSFKITRRYQNAHAYVNAGFLLKLDQTRNFTLTEKPRIVFGGINSNFIHASATEAFLEHKSLSDENVIQKALAILDTEIIPDVRPLEADPAYRKQLTKSLLYKVILGILNEKPERKLQSGGLDLERFSSSGKQTFDEKLSEQTLYKPVTKVESAAQVSGEAEFTNDIPRREGELFGAFVLADIPCGDLKSIDSAAALAIPGVVKFVSATDIPGENNYSKYGYTPMTFPEPIFVDKKVSYHGQAIGMIVAETREIAEKAVKLVKASYENVTKPVVSIESAYQAAVKAGVLDQHYIGNFKSHKPAGVVSNTIKGEFRTGSQYHFYMETQSCLCVPTEDGMDVFSANQWIGHVQMTIADVLGVPCNTVNTQVKRVGGGFGGKGIRATAVAAACAVAANSTKKPVRVALDLETNMRMIGKRCPYLMKYEVGFDDSGKIGSLTAEIFCDTGNTANEATSMMAAFNIQNVYDAIGWEVKPGVFITNKPANVFTRAPGSVQGTALIEYIMEHIAYTLRKDPLEVRVKNFIKKGDPFLIGDLFDPTKLVTMESEFLIPRMIQEMKSSADYENRKQAVKKFNEENRWRKKGLAMVPIKYPIDYFPGKFQTSIVVYATDGTVAVSHAGVEMGQGLNTKVAQTVAETLQIPISKIQVKATNTFISNNALCTGGSIGSELCCYAALKASEMLMERIKPVRESLGTPSWEELIKKCQELAIELSTLYSQSPADGLEGYPVWALNLTEVEIDVLTGENKVVRVDLIEDAGKSLNPTVDIGQIEGGYIFGQGLWTTEKIVHDENTGKLLTDRTWDYKPPESKDIPEDLRITLLSNAPNPVGVLRSKATGEPITCSSVAVLFALRDAIASARRDAGNTDWFQIDGPVTPEDVARLCLTSNSKLGL